MFSIDPFIVENLPKSRPGKSKLIPAIMTCLSYSEKARREGLLSLEDDLPQILTEKSSGWSPMLRRVFHQLLRMSIDGTSLESINRNVEIIALSHRVKGLDFLHLLLIQETINAIYKKIDSRDLKNTLIAWAGLDLSSHFDETCESSDKEEELKAVEEFVKRIESHEPSDSSFDELISKLNDKNIQIVFSKIENRDLVLATRSVTVRTARSFFRNMSRRTCYEIVSENRDLGEIAPHYVEEAQKKIIETIRELEEEHAIYFTK